MEETKAERIKRISSKTDVGIDVPLDVEVRVKKGATSVQLREIQESMDLMQHYVKELVGSPRPSWIFHRLRRHYKKLRERLLTVGTDQTSLKAIGEQFQMCYIHATRVESVSHRDRYTFHMDDPRDPTPYDEDEWLG